MQDHQVLFIRVDASSEMGTGHVMRCIALGQAWLDEKWADHRLTQNVADKRRVVSICAQLPDALEERLHREGFEVVKISAQSGTITDADETLRVIAETVDTRCRTTKVESPTTDVRSPISGIWLVLDGYQFHADYQRAIRSWQPYADCISQKSVRKSTHHAPHIKHQTQRIKLLVIDDYNHLPEYKCDILLNQNLGAEKYAYNINAEAKLLCGPKYVLLRREFREAATLKSKDEGRIPGDKFAMVGEMGELDSNHWNDPRRKFQPLELPEKKVPIIGKKILVTMGGADPKNVSSKVLEALNLIHPIELDVKIVLGVANPWKERVEDLAIKSPHRVELLCAVDDMPELMLWADFVITAAGSTCWELACIGVPFMTVVVADNQQGIARMLDSSGCAPTIKEATLRYPSELAKNIENALFSISSLGERDLFVDAYGAGRVVNSLRECAI